MSSPILNIQQPWAKMIVRGEKTIETRQGKLSEDKVWVPIYIAATTKGKDKTQIIGMLIFSGSKEYKSKTAFARDRKKHKVKPGDEYDWKPGRWGWIIEEAWPVKPFPAPTRGRRWGRTK
jgi:hypothetical protein